MITDVGHPAFRAYDLDETLTFYKKLGLSESFRLNHADGSVMLVYLHVSGDRFLEIFPNGPEPDPNGVHNFHHLCLLTDNLTGMVERLRKQDVAIQQEPKMGLDHNLQAWIRDPDGNDIELMELSEESPQRKVARSA
ncbi:MAG: VOC family protein [Thermomicrobiales bacterium]